MDASEPKFGNYKHGNNAPCPCGSGKKFKKCCLFSGTSPKPLEKLHANIDLSRKRVQERVTKFGHIRAPVAVSNNGLIHVAVGSTVYTGKWKTFQDFLVEYIKRKLTAEWGNAEIKKPAAERHPIIDLYQNTCFFQKTLTRNEQGLYTGIVSGAARAYSSLAYDIYVMDHHMYLTPDHIHRLKQRDSFQGVRFELMAATTFLRAGFVLEMENEKDKRSKHTEFVAVHKRTGQRFNVEAKSRRRPGVLGWKGERQTEEDLRIGLVPLINDALKKPAPHPLIIFLDLNLPPEYPFQMTDAWVQRIIVPIVRSRERTEDPDVDPWWLIVLCNHPDHYSDNNDSAPAGYCAYLFGKNSPKVVQHPEVFEDIHRATQQVGLVPQFFEGDENESH
jgi:uncharacterized protein YchJ